MPCTADAPSAEMLIDNHDDLQRITERCGPVVGIDTEFIRTDTFYPIPAMPPYFEADWRERYSVATRISDTGLSVPTLLELDQEAIANIAEHLIRFVKTSNT